MPTGVGDRARGTSRAPRARSITATLLWPLFVRACVAHPGASKEARAFSRTALPADEASRVNGFKPVHFLVGAQALTARNPVTSSQSEQDLAVSLILGGRASGFFVDLAANDAIHLSNTFTLEKNHGWASPSTMRRGGGCGGRARLPGGPRLKPPLQRAHACAQLERRIDRAADGC